MPLITVIIPVYNASSTIRRCIDSIVSHNVEIEIICVDDGSKDGSLQVLEDISRSDKRVIVHHQSNAGAGAARNKGLTLAKGEYIMFCDADDTYEPSTIDYIYQDIKEFGPDYIVFHRKTVTLDGSVNYWGGIAETRTNLSCSWMEYLNNHILQRGHGLGVVTKVFKKSIIDNNGVRFEKFTFGEDMWFNLTYICRSTSFIEDYRAYYMQYQAEGSICLKGYKNYYDLNMLCPDKFSSEHPEFAAKIDSFITSYKYNTLIWSITRILSGIDSSNVWYKYKRLKELTQKEDVQFMLCNYIQLPALSDKDLKHCQLLIRGKILTYSLRTYYINMIKSKILKIVRHV